MGRNSAFSEGSGVPTASDQLRKLGYSDDEIGATAHSLPSTMGEEDKLRTSLRALSAHHSEQVQKDASTRVDTFPAKNQGNARTPNNNDDYWAGRKDQAAESKQNKPPKTATPSRKRAPAPGAKEYKTAKSLAKMARMLGGAKR